MSDQHLRELEAAWRASGTVEDEAAWLRSRVQAGELEEERLELAAYCGHRAAASAAPERAAPDNTRAWVESLREHGQAVAARVAVACGLVAHAAWIAVEETFGRRWTEGDRAAALAAIHAAESWVVCPCWAHQEAAGVAAQVVSSWPPPACCFEYVAGTVRTEKAGTSGWFRSAVEGACVLSSEDQIRSAVRAELVPWALGYSDPVRERVEARQREAAGE